MEFSVIKKETVNIEINGSIESTSISITNLNKREDVVTLLGAKSICAELGVAEGEFSERILKTNKDIEFLYSIDMYDGGRNHDNNQYIRSIKRLMPFRNKNTLIKMKFTEALNVFPDNYFDFIYIDGYAHTGEDEGRTFDDWYPKLKEGGIFAGDDYSPDWPLVPLYVNRFIKKIDRELFLINCKEDLSKTDWSRFPTWFILK
jgi:hypothetical protein